ncbi:hypothetical protein ACX31A_09615 [Dermacoccus nishinomiyaensis]
MTASPRVGVTVTIPADLLIEATEAANRLGVTRSAFVSLALSEHLRPAPAQTAV